MPQTSTDTQKQELTTSNNGLNVRPILKAKSHFFCQIGNITQSANQCFGVKSPTDFRTTSTFTIASGVTINVYAICSGRILIQPQIGSTSKVNLILKPFKQPINELPIKYFVYRGLNLSDFFDVNTSSDLIIKGDESNGSDFTKHLWKEFNKFYETEDSSIAPPEFLASFIGYNNDTLVAPIPLIDSYFHKISEYDNSDPNNPVELASSSYELPIVPRGMLLGTATSSIGLDIVLDDGDYYVENDPNPFKFDLEFARASENVLDNAPTGNTYTDYQKKLIKEASTRFIDPAAFYGLHANGACEVYLNDDTTPTTDVNDIFSNVVNLFSTGNNTYLYIQGNRQRSYNFYGNYTYDATTIENLKIWDDPASVSTVDCGDTNEWPVQVHSSGTELSIQLLTDKHEGAGAYVRIGDLSDNTTHENNFLRGENLVQTDTDGTIDENYTKPITFNIPKTTGATPQRISTVIQLIYEGKKILVQEYIDPSISPAPDPVYHELKDIDDVFGLIDAISNFKSDDPLVLPAVTNTNLQLVDIPNNNGSSDIAVVKTKRTEDVVQDTVNMINVNRITYETLLDNIKRNSGGFMKHSSASIDTVCSEVVYYSIEQNRFYQLAQPYYVQTRLFTDGGESVTGMTLHITDGGDPSKLIVGLTKTENQYFIDLFSSQQLFKPKFFFKNLIPGEQNNFISKEETTYKIYSLKLIAENDYGEIKIYSPSTEVIVYSLDGFAFCSNDYGKHITLSNQFKSTILKQL